jgi:hypothetical protein
VFLFLFDEVTPASLLLTAAFADVVARRSVSPQAIRPGGESALEDVLPGISPTSKKTVLFSP